MPLLSILLIEAQSLMVPSTTVLAALSAHSVSDHARLYASIARNWKFKFKVPTSKSDNTSLIRSFFRSAAVQA